MVRKAAKDEPKGRKGAGFGTVDDVDRIVHEPARLAVMAYLSVLQEADFTYLLNETGLTKGNLGSHLGRLEEAGYIAVDKGYQGKQPRTVFSLTTDGRAALSAWRDTMAEVVAALA